ncbi:MAG: CBS domain-containing protein [Candidatus Micrarchaeota archaeon]
MKKVYEVMRSDVPTLEPEQSIVEAARLMKKHNCWGLAVLDEGRIVGIITDGDLLNEFYLCVGSFSFESDEKIEKRISDFRELKVKDAMTLHPHPISKDANVGDAAEKIKRMGFKRVIVTDEKNKYVGMIERLNILNAILE